MRREENTYWQEAQPSQGGSESRELLEQMLNRPTGGSGFDLESAVASQPLLAFGAAVVAGFLLGSMGDKVGAPGSRGQQWLAPVDSELSLVKSAALVTLTTMANNSLRELMPSQAGQALSSIISRSLPDTRARRHVGSQMSSSGQGGFGQSTGQSTGQGFSQGGFGQSTGQGSGGYEEHRRSERAGGGIGHDTGGGFGGEQVSSAPNTSFDTGAGRGSTGYDSPPEQGGSVSLTNSEVQGTAHLDPYYPPGGAKGPIGGGRTAGKDRALDTHEVTDDEPGAHTERSDKDDLNWH
ncbi:MAG: hypothetical protein RLZZ387_3968 [Chloroflexota bacterium]